MLDARGMLELVRIMLDVDRWECLNGRLITLRLPNHRRVWMIGPRSSGCWVERQQINGTVVPVIPTCEAHHLGVLTRSGDTAWVPLMMLLDCEVEIDITDLMPVETPATTTATP